VGGMISERPLIAIDVVRSDSGNQAALSGLKRLFWMITLKTCVPISPVQEKMLLCVATQDRGSSSQSWAAPENLLTLPQLIFGEGDQTETPTKTDDRLVNFLPRWPVLFNPFSHPRKLDKRFVAAQ